MCNLCPIGCNTCEIIDADFTVVKCTERTDPTDDSQYLDARGVLRDCDEDGYKTADAAYNSVLLISDDEKYTCEVESDFSAINTLTCGNLTFRKYDDTTSDEYKTPNSATPFECKADFTAKPSAILSSTTEITDCIDYKYNVKTTARRMLTAAGTVWCNACSTAWKQVCTSSALTTCTAAPECATVVASAGIGYGCSKFLYYSTTHYSCSECETGYRVSTATPTHCAPVIDDC